MAEHLLYTAEQVASSTVAALRYQSNLARLVNTDFSAEFIPGRGASVTVLNPVVTSPARTYTAENRASGDAITYDALVEPYTTVKVTDQVYKAVKLPDDFTTFTLTDIERQVVAPMVEQVADAIDKRVADTLATVQPGLSSVDTATNGQYVGANGTGYDTPEAMMEASTSLAGIGLGLKASGRFAKAQFTAKTNGDVLKTIRLASQLLSKRGVPQVGRTLVVGAGWEAALMSQEVLTKVNEAGNGDVLRSATIGQLYGFTVVANYNIGDYAAYALNRDAVTLVTRTTATPLGASFAANRSAEGFSVRYLQDYDPDHLTDRAVVDTFAGASVLDAQRIVAIAGTEGFEEKAEAAASEPDAA